MKRNAIRCIAATLVLFITPLTLAQVAVPRPGTAILKPIWHVAAEGRGLPVADKDAAFFLSRTHELVAIDSRSGSVRWRKNIGYSGSETTQGSNVVMVGPTIIAGDYNVFAFDRETGAARWAFVPDDRYGPGYYLGAAAASTVYAGSPAGRLYAIDAQTGRAPWMTVVMNDRMTTVYEPVVNGEIVAAGFTTFSAPQRGGVVVVDAGSGRVIWRSSFPVPANPSLSTGTTGRVVVTQQLIIAPSGNGEVVAFDRSSGQVRWVIPKLADVPPPVGSPDFDIRSVAALTGR